MALYIPPTSSRTSALISQSSSFCAKMTRAVLRKRCTVRKSMTAASQFTSTSHLGKPNSTFLHLHLFLQDCIPARSGLPRFLKVRCYLVRTSPTIAPRTHTSPVLPFTATNEPAICSPRPLIRAISEDARREPSLQPFLPPRLQRQPSICSQNSQNSLLKNTTTLAHEEVKMDRRIYWRTSRSVYTEQNRDQTTNRET